MTGRYAMHVDGSTKLYGIIGNPVSHSLSPAMHNAAFQFLGENRVYLPFPVERLNDALTGLKGLGIAGVSVTIPHKESVIPFLDEVDPLAEKIGAVNTIVVSGAGDSKRLFGTNTDWVGANHALQQTIDLPGRRALILGAGGSARAIAFGLLEAGVDISLCSRTPARGQALAEYLSCRWLPLADAARVKADILVNATSVGMTPGDQHSPLPDTCCGNFRVVMDIVYAPLQTRLLREAAAAGCSCINGLEMLLYQGVAQFELWTGSTAPVAVMRKALHQEIASRTGNH